VKGKANFSCTIKSDQRKLLFVSRKIGFTEPD
jgi:hypothetical protein